VSSCNGCFLLGTYQSNRKPSCDLALSSHDENACVILLEELNNVGLCKQDGGA
jgi:hypothetical protein